MNHRDADQPPVDDRHEVVVLDPVGRHQADVEAGAAHVGGHHVAEPGLPRQMLAGRDPGHRPGVDGLQRVGGVELRHPARVVVDQHGLGVAMVAEVLLQLRQGVVHRGVQEGVDDGGGGPHVFALAAGQLVGEQHGDRAQLVGRVLLQEDLLHPQFVPGVLHRVGQADHQRLRAGVDQFAQLPPDVVLVQGQQHPAGVVDPLPHGPDEGLRHQRVGAGAAGQVVARELVQALAVAAAARQRDGRLETRGDDRSDLRALALDQRVGAQRGRVPDRVDLGEHVAALQPELGAGLVQGLVEALGQVVVGGERLGLDVVAVPGEEAVGERAADVDGDALHVWSPYRQCRWPASTGTSRPSGITVPAGRLAHCAFSAATSICMSNVGGWPGGRYSVSTSVPQPGQ